MGNGIYDTCILFKIVEMVDKVQKLQRKYGDKNREVSIGNRIKIKEDFFDIIIYINNNRWVKISKLGLPQACLCGATFGLIKSHLAFVTTDKHATSKDYVDTIYKEMEMNLPKLEAELKRKSKTKWN